MVLPLPHWGHGNWLDVLGKSKITNPIWYFSPMASFQGYGIRSSEYRRISWGLFFAGLACFALLYDTQPLLPDLSEHFKIPADQASLSVSATTFGLALALLVVGPLSERFGRKPLMMVGLTVSPFIGIACGFANTWHLHLGLRFLLGIFLSGLPAVGVAYLSEELDRKAQTAATGLYIGGNALGGMSGRLIIGFLNDWWGWQQALIAMGAVALLAALIAISLLPASRGFQSAPLRFRSLCLSTKMIFQDLGLVLLFLIGGSAMGAFVGVFNIVSYYLQEAPFSLAPSLLSLIFLVYLLGSVSSTLSGQLAMRFSTRKVAPFGALIMLIGLGLTGIPSLPLVVTGIAVFTTGFFSLHGVASGWTGARASAGLASTGQASSLYMVFYYSGSAFIGAGAGWAWHLWHWWGVCIYSGSFILLALVCTLILRKIPSLDDRFGPDKTISRY